MKTSGQKKTGVMKNPGQKEDENIWPIKDRWDEKTLPKSTGVMKKPGQKTSVMEKTDQKGR